MRIFKNYEQRKDFQDLKRAVIFLKEGNMKIEKNKELTTRQQRFCLEYLIDCNATKAAIRAGYSEKTARSIGQENLTKPDIQAEIQRLKKPIEEKLQISAEWVLKGWKEIFERCMTSIPVLDSKGNPTGEYRFDSSGANRALELIAKYIKMPEQLGKDQIDPLVLFAMEVFQLPPDPSGEEIERLTQLRMQATRALHSRKSS